MERLNIARAAYDAATAAFQSIAYSDDKAFRQAHEAWQAARAEYLAAIAAL